MEAKSLANEGRRHRRAQTSQASSSRMAAPAEVEYLTQLLLEQVGAVRALVGVSDASELEEPRGTHRSSERQGPPPTSPRWPWSGQRSDRCASRLRRRANHLNVEEYSCHERMGQRVAPAAMESDARSVPSHHVLRIVLVDPGHPIRMLHRTCT